MAVRTESDKRAALSDYLAAERTLLAWIRTGLALMGFGFVVARFGLFLQRLLIMESTIPEQWNGLSVWFGTALIVAGIVVNAFAGWHHIQLVRQLDKGEEAHSRASLQAVAVAFFLAVAGLVMAAYLVSVRGPTHSQSKNKKEISLMLQGNGIVSTPSNHSVDETQANSASQGRHLVCRSRSQRGSSEGRDENASYQAADFRKPEGGNSRDVGGSKHRPRPAAEDSGLGGWAGEGLDFL